MKKITSFFDDILKVIAFVTIILTIVGFIDQKLFYLRLGVSINEYITASEILLSSLDKIGLVLLAVFIQMAIWLYLFNHLYDYSEKDIQAKIDSGEIKSLFHDETIHRFISNKFLKIYGLVLMILSVITAVVSSFLPYEKWLVDIKNFITINFWVAMCIFLGWLQSARGIWVYLKKSENYNPKFVTAFFVFLQLCL
jgi:hypothetical protein